MTIPNGLCPPFLQSSSQSGACLHLQPHLPQFSPHLPSFFLPSFCFLNTKTQNSQAYFCLRTFVLAACLTSHWLILPISSPSFGDHILHPTRPQPPPSVPSPLPDFYFLYSILHYLKLYYLFAYCLFPIKMETSTLCCSLSYRD